jgi:hypothetical protein
VAWPYASLARIFHLKNPPGEPNRRATAGWIHLGDEAHAYFVVSELNQPAKVFVCRKTEANGRIDPAYLLAAYALAATTP